MAQISKAMAMLMKTFVRERRVLGSGSEVVRGVCEVCSGWNESENWSESVTLCIRIIW